MKLFHVACIHVHFCHAIKIGEIERLFGLTCVTDIGTRLQGSTLCKQYASRETAG